MRLERRAQKRSRGSKFKMEGLRADRARPSSIFAVGTIKSWEKNGVVEAIVGEIGSRGAAPATVSRCMGHF